MCAPIVEAASSAADASEASDAATAARRRHGARERGRR